MRILVQILTSLSGLRIQHCHELQCSLQTGLGSGIAVAVVWASICNSYLTPTLGTSTCCWCSLKKIKIKKYKNALASYSEGLGN